MHTGNLSYGPRLVAQPTAHLRAALLVMPGTAIENAPPVAGETNAILSRAISEQNILIKTLRYFGCEVTLLAAHTDDPYACAAADLAVVFENGAVMLRPSSLRRRPESGWLEAEFQTRDFPIAGHIAAPGLLDGGDVLMAGSTAFIGVSPRSNTLGRTGFAQISRAHGFNTVEVALGPRAANLRSVAGVISANTIAVAGEDALDVRAFAGFKMLVMPRGEELGAGVLNLGEGHVLSSVRFPRANDVLRKAGVTVEAIDLHDFGRIGITPSMLAVDLKRA